MNELRDVKDRQAWGIAFVVFGVLLGNTLYEFVGKSIDLVNVFMFLGILLIIDYDRLLQLNLPRLTKKTVLLYVFQLYILFVFLFYRHSFVAGNFTSDIAYILFSLALITALASNPKCCRWTKVIKVSFIVSTIIIFLITYVLFTGDNLFVGRFRFSSGADPLQMGFGLTSCFAVFLLYDCKGFFGKIVRIIDIAFLIIAEFAFSCRTAIFTCAIMFVLHFMQLVRISLGAQKPLSKIILKLFLALLAFFITFITVYNLIPGIKTVIDNMGNYMLRGIYTLYGNNSLGIDESASTRVYTQRVSLDIIWNETNPFKVLFGHGYMTLYVDVPILQAMLDLGIVGWLLYTYIVVLNPILTILNRSKITFASKDENYRLQYLAFTLLAVTAIGKQLTSALPYGHDVYLGAILCWFLA